VKTKKEMNELRRAEIAANIKKARESKGLSKAETARCAKMRYTTYDSYERGDREPNIDMVQLIANALNVNWWELMGYKGWLVKIEYHT